MVYLILIIGLILIYLALKSEKKEKNPGVFSNLVSKKTDSSDLESIRDEIGYLSARVDDIEKALIIIDDILRQNSSPEKLEKTDEFESAPIISDFNYKIPDKAIDTPDVIEPKTVQDNKNDNINSTIFEMFDSGKNVDEIASVLRIGKGEVSLRLGLRKKGK